MISSVSSTTPVASVQGPAPSAPKPVKTKADTPIQDTVHLSSAATASGDIDHDGDSH
jgi:hypothetical protein